MNPRYLAYCRANCLSPEHMLEHDRMRFPGGCMAGFIIWHSEQIALAKIEIPQAFFMGHIMHHEIYDRWLNGRF